MRLGLSAVAGGGKTYTALLVAFGLCGDWTKIAVIDTENNSADLYSHLGDYNVLPLLPPFSPERYIGAIQDCEKAGMEVIIIDSITHEWDGQGGILNLADTIGGGFQVAWKALTPRHERFKQAILQSTSHIITTVRRKQEYALQEGTNRQGHTTQKPVKLGLKEITREGWEYELTLNLEIDVKHYASASKDRTGLFANADPFIPSVETGKIIKQWCDSGAEPLPLPVQAPAAAPAPAIVAKELVSVTSDKFPGIVDAVKNKGYKIAQVQEKYDLDHAALAALGQLLNPAAAPAPVTQQDIKDNVASGKPF